MKHRLKKHFTLLILPLILWGCGADAKIEESTPTTTFAHFSIRYLEGEQQLRGQASFSQGDSLEVATPLQITGGVSFMGSGMKQKSLPKQIIRYDSEMKGSFIAPFRFGFKLGDDKNPRQVLYNMGAIGDFSISSASKSDGLHIKMESPIREAEGLLLLFTDANGEGRPVLQPGAMNKEDLFIPANALEHFIAGACQLYLVKTKKEQHLENGVNSEVLIEFYSKEINFVLEE